MGAPQVLFLMLAVGSAAVGIAWNVAIMVLLYKIWQKVKHLPG
jgi:hypothetical protein